MFSGALEYPILVQRIRIMCNSSTSGSSKINLLKHVLDYFVPFFYLLTCLAHVKYSFRDIKPIASSLNVQLVFDSSKVVLVLTQTHTPVEIRPGGGIVCLELGR